MLFLVVMKKEEQPLSHLCGPLTTQYFRNVSLTHSLSLQLIHLLTRTHKEEPFHRLTLYKYTILNLILAYNDLLCLALIGCKKIGAKLQPLVRAH